MSTEPGKGEPSHGQSSGNQGESDPVPTLRWARLGHCRVVDAASPSLAQGTWGCRESGLGFLEEAVCVSSVLSSGVGRKL